MGPITDSDDLTRLSALQTAKAIAGGRTTAEAVTLACLARIAAREPDIRAWATIDPDYALAQARMRDREPVRGPLHGVPIGIKDVIDTADLPTEMGSRLYRGYRPKADAACVARLRDAGAIVLGKTSTAEFAGASPTMTRNPHALDHTPGGSSSGSAAAVADFMVPAALGTQTGGSVLRPASFCGLIGFKPSFGRINPAGIKPAAESFDTVGMIARTLDDVETLFAVLTNDRAPAAVEAVTPRLGLCRTHLWPTAQAETVVAVENAVAESIRAGAAVRDIAWPENFAELSAARAVINAYERAHSLGHEWRVGAGEMTPQIYRVCSEGRLIRANDYVEAQQCARRCREEVASLFQQVDVLIAPCVPGEAPVGLDYAGDPRFQEIWTMLHLPTIALPTHRGPHGLPVGIQLVAPRDGERVLLAASRWLLGRLT